MLAIVPLPPINRWYHGPVDKPVTNSDIGKIDALLVKVALLATLSPLSPNIGGNNVLISPMSQLTTYLSTTNNFGIRWLKLR